MDSFKEKCIKLNREEELSNNTQNKCKDTWISICKLTKAKKLWSTVCNGESIPESRLSDEQIVSKLIMMLCDIHPEHIAIRSGGKWFAGGYRVVGVSVLDDRERTLLFSPQVHRWGKLHTMSNLKPLMCLPIQDQTRKEEKDVIIISDSTLNQTGIIYGLACELREHDLNLLWIATIPGAGMKELWQAWVDAPTCQWGLTVANLNDALKSEPWCMPTDALDSLKNLLDRGTSVCKGEHCLFINEASYYPKLRQDEYQKLVNQVSDYARVRETRVFNGSGKLDGIALQDKVHFAVQDTAKVVRTYLKAILDMKNQFDLQSSEESVSEGRRSCGSYSDLQSPEAERCQNAD